MPRYRPASLVPLVVLAAVVLSVPAPARAWKVDTHVYAANLVLEEARATLTFQEVPVTDAALGDRVRNEIRRVFGNGAAGQTRLDYLDNALVQYVWYLVDDRLVRLRPVMHVQVPPFGWLRLDEDAARALLWFPQLFRAGAVGPDLFPDLLTGQTVIHPGQGPRSGRWAAFLESEVRRVAGLYHGGPGEFDGSSIIRSYYLGWLAHMAGDLFGHAWVNDYAGGVWPEITDGFTDEERKNIIRHLIVEAYVSKKIGPAYLAGDRVALDVPAGAHLTDRYLMTWVTGNGGRIDHDDSEDDRFEVNPIITGYAGGTPYHLSLLFSIRDDLRRVTRNIDWDALWAGFIMQMLVGYFDFGQASLLYNHQWFHDVDTALDRLVDSQVTVARRMSAGEGFGAWFDEIERWMLRYGLSALGLPDAVGRGIEMSGEVQERIADAILPDEVEAAMSDLKRWFVDKVMEEAFGVTLTEVENYLRDPGSYLDDRSLFPAGTRAKIDGELGNFGQAFPVDECYRNSFGPFLDTLNMIKLQLVEPAELARIMFAERALPWNDPNGQTTEAGLAQFVAGAFPRSVQMQFMRSLDAGYDYDRPDFAGCLLWDNAAIRQKIFHRIFHVERPAAGLKPVLSTAGRKLEIGHPPSMFRPRFVWRAAAPSGASGPGSEGTSGGTVVIPRPASGGTVDATGQLPGSGQVDLGGLPEREVPDFGVVLKPRPFGRAVALPAGVHVHAATLASFEAAPPPPVVMRFFADAGKYVVDGRMKDAASVAKLGAGGVLVPLDLVARELGAGLAYDAAKGVATLETPDGTFVLAAGKAGVTAGGLTKPLTRDAEAVPVATATTLLVPPGFFEDHLGCRVVSLEKDKTAVVERRKFADDAPATVTGEPAAEETKPTAAGAASPWAGKWETTIGAMDIAVAADGVVDFAYDGEFGRLTGRVDGGRLAGRFAEDNGARGDIVLTLGRENRTFSGQWRRTDIDGDYWHGCEGWRPFEAGAAGVAPGESPAVGAADAAASAWAGEWDTTIGDLVLRAAGAGLVAGGYDGTFGRVEAKVEGGRLTGRFTEDTGSWGEIELVLEAGGGAFKGRWRRLNVEADDWHPCEGVKIRR
ncbi:MAG: hypothetical protein KA243_05785 [Candidatus Aminicenantes bacterium]|nr:hypothetical protein [Candidatus Aminicenantes bacterium]NLH77400.1 hypothetical protein [Acidobacteriota bacterium]